MKTVLTIAGTDPSGAAGIQADLQVIRDHGQHGLSTVTAVIAQNTVGVQLVHALPADLLRAQLRSVFDDFDVTAIKVGLVPNDELIDVVMTFGGGLPIVWDPVLASGDGLTALFSGTNARLGEAVCSATLVTPNIGELEALTGTQITSRALAADAAKTLASRGATVLVKVGHLPNDGTLSDMLVTADGARDLVALRAVSDDVRGTGCQLSTAIASGLAAGAPLEDAVEDARKYLNALLQSAGCVGKGRAVILRL